MVTVFDISVFLNSLYNTRENIDIVEAVKIMEIIEWNVGIYISNWRGSININNVTPIRILNRTL